MDNQAPDFDERLAFLFLRQAPFLPSAEDLGMATCPVEPWPHQLRVVRETTRRFPESFLFCDEVGLGKTIEAGLALRQLVISGRVRRALLLVPHGLLRQWQEELHEKLVLRIPRYEGGRFLDVDHREIPTQEQGAGAWNAHPLILASSQLARRRDRREELLAADPWDLVIVDEAHHARRRGLGTSSTQPNRLLELLAGTPRRPGLKHRTRCLYLLTATPMQIHPLEVWDLLRLLGLGGRWGAREETFLQYFEELRQPFETRDWPRLLELLAESVELSEGFDPTFMQRLQAHLEPEEWKSLEQALSPLIEPRLSPARTPRAAPQQAERATILIKQLKAGARPALDSLLHHHTPLLTFAWRNTRDLLRRYQRRGLLKVGIPKRRPRNVWIDFSKSEGELYRRIETYITESYQRYEAQRPGLGFVMTVYRRRLTSSFFAVRRSLERRLASLSGQSQERPATVIAVIDEDLSTDDLFPQELLSTQPLFGADLSDERAYLEDFLRDLNRLRGDSKRTRLRRDLRRLLKKKPSALVFTQYTDTLDHLRDALRQDHQNQVACYSGRGGEVWDGEGWVACGKELLKERFRCGDVRILLATEAAGEGLNLQTCGLLINYDMPWNPMRVEQRIGRIDRIGQVFDEVWIYNYFYRDSVEAEIYRRLADRIGWFEEVVGKLQPILHGVGESIQHVAMAPAERRRQDLEEEIGRLEQQLEKHNPEWLELDRDLENLDTHAKTTPPPVSWRDIQSLMLASPTLGSMFSPDVEIQEAYWLEIHPGSPRRVTFSPEIFDHHPYSLDLLTYGNPLFHQLLEKVELPEESEDPQGIGLYRSDHPAPVSLFLCPPNQGAEPIADLVAFSDVVGGGAGPWRGAEEGEASTVFSQERKRMLRRMSGIIERRRQARLRALVQRARQILIHTALVELARDRTPTLFDAPLPYGFGREAIAALVRHGDPFPELFEAIDDDSLEARADDPFYLTVEGRSPAHLDNRWLALLGQGKDLIDELHRLEADLVQARRNLREPSSGGLLERSWFPVANTPAPQSGTISILPKCNPDEVRPFKNAVPLYPDLSEAASRFANSEDHTLEDGASKDHAQADEERHPGGYSWVTLEGRTHPAVGLFVARAGGGHLENRIATDSWCLFRLLHDPRNRAALPRNGQIVLASHHTLEDPGLGKGFGLRIFEKEELPSGEGGWPVQKITLGVASPDETVDSLVLQDEDDGGLRLIAELIEILG